MGGAQAGVMGLNDPRGRPDRVFRIRKEGTQYGDDDNEDDEYADDTALYTIWNRYIDEESGQPYYYNTETGDTSFKPPEKVRELLEKEMEEKALMDTGADLPDELKVYAAQVEADAEERRLEAFKKEREEAAAEDQKILDEKLKKSQAISDQDKEFEDADTRRRKEKEYAQTRRKNAEVRQQDMIKWIKNHAVKLRFYDVHNKLLPTESRFHESLYKDPGEVTDEELAAMYKFQHERETRWDIEERAAIKLQVHWRLLTGGFSNHVKRQAQVYADEHKRNEEERMKAMKEAKKRQEELQGMKKQSKLKQNNASFEDKVNRLTHARQQLLEADGNENVDTQALLRELMGEDAHTDLSAALTNDKRGEKAPDKSLMEKMKQALVMMEQNLYKTCFLGWKYYTREAVFYRKALHRELNIRFHRWHFNAHRLRRLRTRMQKVTVTFYYENIHWAFHRWYMRTRVNFDIRVVKWKGKTHRVLVMRGDLSKRDSDGLLGVKRDALLLPRDARGASSNACSGTRYAKEKQNEFRVQEHVYW